MENSAGQWSPEYITVGYIARYCGVSNTTVLRWISAGRLPAFRLPGGHFRIDMDDFTSFLTEHGIPFRPLEAKNEESHR